MKTTPRALLTLVLLSSLLGCDLGDEDGALGYVPPSLRSACIAEFEEDTPWGALDLLAGDEFLLDFEVIPGRSDGAYILGTYLQECGLARLLLDPYHENFYSRCLDRRVDRELRAFIDTPIYARRNASRPSCEIPRGVAVPIEAVGWWDWIGGDLEIDLAAFSRFCPDLRRGYVRSDLIFLEGERVECFPMAPILTP